MNRDISAHALEEYRNRFTLFSSHSNALSRAATAKGFKARPNASHFSKNVMDALALLSLAFTSLLTTSASWGKSLSEEELINNALTLFTFFDENRGECDVALICFPFTGECTFTCATENAHDVVTHAAINTTTTLPAYFMTIQL
mmetsp:Transcript_41114/g.60353  ORF Transcript_41114/g.60353 Transcript_41114/m.60353 type:complete len:144 (-) Transcript_41114:122-553(-)